MAASRIERAIAFALEMHTGQRDKAGEPYILHPLRLMQAMASEDERCAAVLHDVVEDSDASFADLAALGLSEATLDALRLLTHDGDDGSEDHYFAYIAGIKANPIARRVKLADLADNLTVQRLSRVSEKDARRLDKYLRAKALLEAD